MPKNKTKKKKNIVKFIRESLKTMVSKLTIKIYVAFQIRPPKFMLTYIQNFQKYFVL
jgi:hypothetical protein